MHKVKPNIVTFNQENDFALDNITVITLKNKSVGFDWRFSFGEGFDLLKEGETISYEAGANTVFARGTLLKLEPVKVNQILARGDYKEVVISYNKLTEASAGWSDILQ